MISLFTYLIALVAAPASFHSAEIKTEDPKLLEWKKETHDFGNVTEGTKAKYTFTFINKGTEPAVVIHVDKDLLYQDFIDMMQIGDKLNCKMICATQPSNGK